jgi:hypothetical protein
VYSRTRKYLFLQFIYKPTISKGDKISSFFVRRLVFFIFFKRLLKNSLFKRQGGNPLLLDLKDAIQVDYNYAITSFNKSTSFSLTFTTSEDFASTFAIFKDNISDMQTLMPLSII